MGDVSLWYNLDRKIKENVFWETRTECRSCTLASITKFSLFFPLISWPEVITTCWGTVQKNFPQMTPAVTLTEYHWVQHWLHWEHRCSTWSNVRVQPHIIKSQVLLRGRNGRHQNLNLTCIFAQLLPFYLYYWQKHRSRLFSSKQKYFLSIIIFRL